MAGISDSSSSDEDEEARLRDATIIVGKIGVNHATCPANKNDNTKSVALAKKPSQRSKVDDEEDHELRTTPEFRSHVAKKLTSILDGVLEVEKNEQVHKNSDQESSEDSGFKLFASSIVRASVDVKPVFTVKHRLSSSSSSDDEDLLAGIAVSGHDILESAKTDSGFSWQAISEKHCDHKKDPDHKSSLVKKQRRKHKNSSKEKAKNKPIVDGQEVVKRKHKKKRKKDDANMKPD